jgi:hypothetical protein
LKDADGPAALGLSGPLRSMALGGTRVARDLHARVLAILGESEPLDRLRFLLEIRESTPALRDDALSELEASGWTRYRIADDLGVSRQAVYRW